jgi:type IV secretory pathway VirB10-like protein
VQFVQIVLTDEQAALVAKGLPLALSNTTPEEWETNDPETTEADVQSLAMFFAGVATEPSRFPVTGRMAGRLKKASRAAKGPAQPQSRRRKRSQGQQKRDRAARKEAVDAYNAARERYEQDVKEMEEAHAERVAQIEAMLAQKSLQHEELVELFALLGSPDLSAKTAELYAREHNPQAIIDAVAAARDDELADDPALD